MCKSQWSLIISASYLQIDNGRLLRLLVACPQLNPMHFGLSGTDFEQYSVFEACLVLRAYLCIYNNAVFKVFEYHYVWIHDVIIRTYVHMYTKFCCSITLLLLLVHPFQLDEPKLIYVCSFVSYGEKSHFKDYSRNFLWSLNKH